MTIKKRLLLSNILMIIVPVLAALTVGICCIALLWLMFRMGGALPLEDSGDFSWASRAVVKLVSRSLEEGETLDTLGETLRANGLRLTVISGGSALYTYGEEQPEDAHLLRAAESLGGTQALASTGEHSLSVAQRRIHGTDYQIRVYGIRSGELPSGMKLTIILAGLILLCAVSAAIRGTNRFLVRFVLQKINGPLMILSEGVREIGNGNLDYRIDYREKDEFAPVCGAFNEMAARLKISVERTRREEESQKELMAGISHGLRSPLTSIQAYVEVLLDGVAKTPQARQRYLSTIKTKAEDIDRMVSQLFLFSKLDLAEYPMEPQSLRLDELISTLAAETAQEYQSRGLKRSAKQLCPVRITADGMLLRRVLTNIMDNSAKYRTADLGRLWIDLDEAGEHCRITLTDDGPGVPEEALPRLFDAALPAGGGAVNFAQMQPLQYGYLLVSGALAVMAMVLPGVSGSTLLLIMGVYLPAVSAIYALLRFDLAVLPGLIALGLGIIAGAALSIHSLRNALRRYRSQMLYLILGLMLGSAVSIVMGPATLPVPREPLSLGTFQRGGLPSGCRDSVPSGMGEKGDGEKRTAEPDGLHGHGRGDS